MTIGRTHTNSAVVKQDTKNRWKNSWEKKPANVFSKPMRNHLDLSSLKVDNSAITLNIIHRYTNVRKITLSKVLKWAIGVKWMLWIGEWLNRQKVRMPPIAWDDASTHGKFISHNKESNQQPSDCQFSCPHSTITRRYILAKLGILPTMLRLLVRLR